MTTNGTSNSGTFSPFGTSKGNKAAPYERPAHIDTVAPIDDETGAPASPGGIVYGLQSPGTGGSDATKIH